MALKSTNPIHIQKAGLLKRSREEAGFTQQELANRLQVSRETVSAIENCHRAAMSALSEDLREQWWKVCESGASIDTKVSFVNLITRIFKL